MSKIGRNEPCPCGSGLKYKKCCGKNRIMNEKPKNTFRDKVAAGEVSEQELLERDQRATYLELKNQAEMRETDRLHLQGAIAKLKVFGNEIFQLPDSEGRAAILEQNKKHIERLEKQLEVSATNRPQRVLLSILEEKFGEADENVAAKENAD